MYKTIVPLLLVVLLAAVMPVAAQVTTADLVGKVSDPKGLAVLGAKVTVLNKDTGLQREAQTSDSGDFAITLLPPGTYKVTVEKEGFTGTVFESVDLVVGQKRTLDVALKLGAMATLVTVTEEAPLVETTSSEIGGSVAPVEVKELPVVDRNFAGLMTLVPGVRPAENFDPTKTRSGNVTVNGSDGRAIDYNVDGGDNKDNVIGGLVQNFTMEGIQEFNVVTDRYTAESGRAVAAVVNVISKTGTNHYHGDALGLFQNNGLNARSFTLAPGQPNPLFHRYQFGGSFGGPILHDKLFAFGAYEQKREPGSINVDPSAFTQLQVLQQAFSNLVSPVTQLPFPYRDHLLTVRVDHQISGRQSMYYRYGREKWYNPNDQLGNPFVTDLSQANSDLNQFHDFVIGHNLVVSTNKVNKFTVHFQDFANSILASPGRTFTLQTQGGGTATNPEICFKPTPGCGGGAPEVEIGQNVNVPQQTLIRKYQFRDDFSWNVGKHDMKFGANYIYLAKLGGFFFFGANGYQVTFWDNPSVIASTPALYPQKFATPGAVQELTFNSGSGSTKQPPAHEIGLYYQDDYKVTSRLTLNLGLRWDANPKFLTPQLTDSPLTTNRAIAILQQVVAAAPANSRDADGLARAIQIAGNSSLLRRNTASWKEFQPRIGFAWDPIGTGKFVIRGGYGIARDQIFQNLTLFSIQQEQPTLYQTLLDLTANGKGTACKPSPTGTPETDLCQFSFGNTPLPVPTSSASALAQGATGRIIDPRLDDPWSQQASIGFAWQFRPDYGFSADYYHVLGTHEPRVLQMNPKLASLCAVNKTGGPAYPGGNPGDPRCVNGPGTRLMDAAFIDSGLATVGGTPRLGEIRLYGTNNRSIYDGINFQLQKRLSRHIIFQVSDVVSWSRSWGGRATSSYSGSTVNITPERQFLSSEFGPTEFDERNRFAASGVFQLPYGFEIAPLFQAATPRPFNALAGIDIDGDGRSSLDRACVDNTATLGCQEQPVNNHRASAFINMDLRTSKAFNIRENMHLQIIWEFYNLFNRNNSCNFVDNNFFSDTTNNIVSSGFGAPQGYCGGQGFGPGFSGPFRSQFGFRFEF
jgi:hypothetical protein